MWPFLNKDLENLGFGSGKQKKLGELIMARHKTKEIGTIDLVHPQLKVPNTFLVQQDENPP